MSGLCHFVTGVEVQCIYIHLDFCSVKCEKKKQTHAVKKQTHAVVMLYVGIQWCYLVKKMKVANTFHFFLIVGIQYRGQLLTNGSTY